MPEKKPQYKVMPDGDMRLVGTVDCEPTWESLLETLVLGVVDGMANARSPYWGELRKMAKAADAYRALQKVGPSTFRFRRLEKGGAMTPSQDLTEWLAAGAFVSLFYTVLFATSLLTWLMLGVLS